jgi:CheY-like chemotaxis protein/anti-sigma regulatory factor (Ser/Thr protein kinase)
MPIIMVVDDSPVDRRLVSALLGKGRELDWLVEQAENGTQALAMMKELVPNVVVTDLLMPGMDGLQLVATLRTDYPQVPVVLITGQGSEALAVEALIRGAASYVPKNQLGDILVDTVTQVLAMASADHTHERLRDCILKTQLTLEFDNDPALISPLVDLVRRALTTMRFGDPTERLHVGIALEEALFNALLHGNLALPAGHLQPARAALSAGKASRFVQERRSQTPYCNRKIFVDAILRPEEARFVIRDQGAGFAPAALPSRGDPKSLEQGSGRGLVLMRNFMDDVTFNGTGNEVTLVKRRP